MSAADEGLLAKVQGLSDLELAFLVSLMSREHCIITAHPSALDDLLEELQLVRSRPFTAVAIHCYSIPRISNIHSFYPSTDCF